MHDNTLQFKKEDLGEIDYSWNESLTHKDIPVVEPSRRLFDRYNGNQILYMINYFSETVQRMTLREAHGIEKLLREKLPLSIKSELSVFRWLVACQSDLLAI